MSGSKIAKRPDNYWNSAGEVSYAEAMYSSADVERHVRQRLWDVCVEIADTPQIPRDGHVLDYGCGDGAFANQVLSRHYRAIDGYDKAPAAIARAQAEVAGPHLKFVTADLTGFDYDALPRYDGAFLVGILHHIKPATPQVMRLLTKVTDKIVVLEPNGGHPLRKLIEYMPAYRAAGEDSFRTRELINVCAAAGWDTVYTRRTNLFPNFTPGAVYRMLTWLEPIVEKSSFLNGLCTVNMLGLKRR
jgi:SAM-dependent methyltransferase